MKNILFLNNSGNCWGGVEKWTYKTAMALNERGYNSFIAARKSSPLYNKSIKSNLNVKEINVLKSATFLNPFKIFSFKRFLVENKINTIFFCSSPTFKFGTTAAILADVENVIYRRGSAKRIKNKFYNRFFLNRGITKFIANSKSTKKRSLREFHDFPEEKVKLIYNGVDIEKFTNPKKGKNLRKEFSISSDKKVIVNVGRLDKQKGQKYLIKAAKTLREKFEDFVIILVGDGVMEENLKDLVSNFELEENILFAGFRNDIPSVLNQADFMVHTALWEGCPWSVIEALAAGLPVIATDTTSLSEIIEEGENGYLANNKDHKNIAKKMYEMLVNTDLDSMSIKAKESALNNYKFDRVVDQVEECIK